MSDLFQVGTGMRSAEADDVLNQLRPDFARSGRVVGRGADHQSAHRMADKRHARHADGPGINKLADESIQVLAVLRDMETGVVAPRCANIEQTFGAFHKTVAMIRIRGEKKGKATAKTLGMQKLWEMVQLRCKHAGVEIADAFDFDTTCHYLCEMSGGHPRHLLMFLQTSIAKIAALPITKDAAHKAVRDYRNSLQREVPTDCLPLLGKFTVPQLEIPKDEQHQQMLFYLHIFEYMNDRQWYEVNPVLRELITART